MKKLLTRYNRGFGKYLSPLEQCSDGELVKYDEVEQFIQELVQIIDDKTETIKRWENVCDDWKYVANEYENSYHEIKGLNKTWDKLCTWIGIGFILSFAANLVLCIKLFL